jgi:carbon-monoxide dehydrogenase medium subunit
MSLIPMMKLRLAMPGTLVDLTGLPELASTSVNGAVEIGALTTHFEIESSKAIREHCPLLSETAAHIGDVQVRNVGTIGGSTAHNDPAADYPAALMALGAKVRLASKSGTREMAIGDFFVDTLTTAIEPGEMITHIIVPVEASGAGTCYQKVPQAASGYAVVGIAVRLTASAGKITDAHVGVTGLAAKAFRATKVEEALKSGASVSDASALVTDGVDASSDVHTSADYRKHLARVHTARAIKAALAKCKG